MRAECMIFERNKNLLIMLGGFAALIWIIVVYGHALLVSSNSLFSTDFYKFYQSALFYFEGQNIYDKIIKTTFTSRSCVHAWHYFSFV